MDVNEKLWEEDGDFASDHNSWRNPPPGPRRRCPCRSVDVLVLLKGRGLLGEPGRCHGIHRLTLVRKGKGKDILEAEIGRGTDRDSCLAGEHP